MLSALASALHFSEMKKNLQCNTGEIVHESRRQLTDIGTKLVPSSDNLLNSDKSIT